MEVRIRLGVSGCLLGQRVRYDGGHKRSACVTGILARQFELVSFCPELAIGLGVPRPPIQLVAVGGETRARGVRDPAVDVTDALAAYARVIAARCEEFGGWVFKARSPSCGVAGVGVFGAAEEVTATGGGIFAHTLRDLCPGLPVVEEDALEDPGQREVFIERILARHRRRR